MDLTGQVFMLAGALLIFLAAVGVVQFPDALSRMHALAKASTAGISLVLFGAALAVHRLDATMSLLFITVLQAATTPVASTLLTQATYYAEGVPKDLQAPDELSSTLDELGRDDDPAESR